MLNAYFSNFFPYFLLFSWFFLDHHIQLIQLVFEHIDEPGETAHEQKYCRICCWHSKHCKNYHAQLEAHRNNVSIGRICVYPRNSQRKQKLPPAATPIAEYRINKVRTSPQYKKYKNALRNQMNSLHEQQQLRIVLLVLSILEVQISKTAVH